MVASDGEKNKAVSSKTVARTRFFAIRWLMKTGKIDSIGDDGQPLGRHSDS